MNEGDGKAGLAAAIAAMSRGDRLMMAFAKIAQRMQLDEAIAKGMKVQVQSGHNGLITQLGTATDRESVRQGIGNEAASILGDLSVEAICDAIVKSDEVAAWFERRIADLLVRDEGFIAALHLKLREKRDENGKTYPILRQLIETPDGPAIALIDTTPRPYADLSALAGPWESVPQLAGSAKTDTVPDRDEGPRANSPEVTERYEAVNRKLTRRAQGCICFDDGHGNPIVDASCPYDHR